MFVGRERELGRLGEFWAAARTATPGAAHAVFITAEAGAGKTTLLRAFAERAQADHPDVVLAIGTCNAQGGLGDPYLPFREVLATLIGMDGSVDAAASAAGGPRRFRRTGRTASAAMDLAPDLVQLLIAGVPGLGIAVHAGTIVARQTSGARQRRARRVEQAGVSATPLDQPSLFLHVTDMLVALAGRHPLLILLDDLHWADAASLNLLFHLARALDQSPLLLVGAFRPEEVSLGHGGDRHPLEKVMAELKRSFGNVSVDLGRGNEQDGRPFVDAIVDSERNQLGTDFRRSLFERTGGHALFTVELLRTMQERGDLVFDDEGRWVEGPTLDWGKLPARVEGVIEERIGRLSAELHDVLQVASVEGQDFTAQVVSRVGQIAERGLVRDLGQELVKRHRLVRDTGESRAGATVLDRYQFSHALFQQYLYDELSPAERRPLHQAVAEVLEELYAEGREQVVVQLARHYSEAGQAEKAITYLLQAGDRARALYAYEEAVDAYERALAFLLERRDHEHAARTLMKLGLTHHTAFDFPAARRCYEEGFALWQRAAAGEPAVVGPAPRPLRIQWAEPDVLDPALVTDIWSAAVIDQLFSGLVQTTPEMEVVPDAAERWEVCDDGRRYVFRLRPDLHWSDDMPLTAGDFEFAWKRLLAPATASSCAVMLFDVSGARDFHAGITSGPDDVGVHAVDDRTLVVDLEQPATYLPYLLTFVSTYPVPRHVVNDHGSSWTDAATIVTNGPFRLESWERGHELVLRRDPGYHGRVRGNAARVALSLRPGGQAAAYDEGTIDILTLHDLTSPDREWLRREHADDYMSIPALFTTFVAVDATRPPFNDRRVRRALAQAVDLATLADVIMGGDVFPAHGGLNPLGMPGHAPGIALAHDTVVARRLLAEAGYANGSGFPAVHANALGASVAPFAEYLTDSWKRVLGIEIIWDTPTYRASLEAPVPSQISLMSWVADYPDPDNFLRLYVDRNLQGASPDLTRLVAQAAQATDQGRRTELYQEADTVLVGDAFCIPLAYNRFQLLVKPWVRSLPTSASSFWFWKDIVLGAP